MDPLHYNDVANEFDRWQAANPQKKMTLSEYAQVQDLAEGAPKRQAAYNDNFLKHVNRGVDELFAPVGNLVAPIGSGIDAIANAVVPSYTGNVGEETMRGTPRTLAEFAGFMIPGGGQIGAGLRIASLAAKGLGMADAGLKGYSETDSPLVGAISAAGLPLTNAMMVGGEKLAAKYLTRGLAEKVAAAPVGGALEATASPLMDQLATFIGGNAGALAASELTNQASSLAQGQGLVNPLTIENAVGQIAGLAPFLPKTLLDVHRGQFAPHAAEARRQILEPYEQTLRDRDAATQAAKMRDLVTGAEVSNKPAVLEGMAADPTVAGQVQQTAAADKFVARSMQDYIASRVGEPPATNPSMFDYDHPALVGQSVDLADQASGIAKTFAEKIVPVDIGPRNESVSTSTGVETPFEQNMVDNWPEMAGIRAAKSEEVKKRLADKLAALKAENKTRPMFSEQLFQGRGARLEDVYGPEAVAEGRAVPLLGQGEYYAPRNEDAANYGAVSQHQVVLNNPLVLKTNQDWYRLLDAAGAQHLNSQGPLFYKEPQGIAAATERLKQYVLSKGHDGVVVRFDQNQKALRESFGHDTIVSYKQPKQVDLAKVTQLSMMRPEDVSTVERLTQFIADVNNTLQTTWDAQTTGIETASADLARAAKLRKTLGITGIDEKPEISKIEVTAFNPLALKELQGEGRVPAITPEWLQKNFGLMLDRSIVDTPQDAYWHTVQKVANLMSDLGEKAKAQKSVELQNRAELQSATRRKTESELDAAHFENVKQLPVELQDWLTQQAAKDRAVTKYRVGGKTPQSVWPMRRDLVDQAIKNLDRATGMTKVTVAQGKERTPLTLTLPLDQAIKGVRVEQTPEGPKEVSFLKPRALRVSEGERDPEVAQSLDAMGEGFAANQSPTETQGLEIVGGVGEAQPEADVSDVATERVGSVTREVKDFGDGPEVTLTSTAEPFDPSRSFNEQDTAETSSPKDAIRQELERIYKDGPAAFDDYAGLFTGQIPNETKAKMRRLFSKAVQATLTDNASLQREFAAEWFGRDPQTVDPVLKRNALQSFWGGNGKPRYEGFVRRMAELTGLKPEAMAQGMYSASQHVLVAGELPDLKSGLTQALKEHALLQGMGPEAQAHFVNTGVRFVELFKGLEKYKFTKIDLEDPLSRERYAQKISENLSLAGLHGMAYMSPDGQLVRNPFIGIALGHSARRSSNTPFYNWLTLSTIGHEAIHSIQNRLADYSVSSDPDLRQYSASYINMHQEATALSPQERFSLLKGAAESILPPQFFKPDGQLNQQLKGYLTHGALSAEEFIPVYAQIYFSGLVTGGEKLQTANVLENNRWATPAVQDFMRGVYRQIGDYAGGIKIMSGASPDMARAVDVLHTDLPKLVRKDAVVAQAEREVAHTAAVLGKNAVSTLADGPTIRGPVNETDVQFMKIAGIDFGKDTGQRINEALGLADDHLFGDQKKLNFWSRNFMPFVQAAARTGQKVAMDAAMTLLDSNRGRTNVSNQLLMPTLKQTEYGGLTINKDHPLRALFEGAAKDVQSVERTAFNDIGDVLQELGDGGKLKTTVIADPTGRLADGFSQLRKLNPDLDKRTAALLSKASPEKRGKILAAVDSALEIYHTGGQVLIKSQQDHMGTRLARVMQTINPDINYDEALQRGSLLMQGIDVQNKAIIDKAVGGFTPEQAQSMLELATQLNAPIGELRKMVAERPFFMSEQRQGQYIITSEKNGQRFVDSADNEQHVTKVGNHLKSLGHADLQWFDKYARYGEFAGDLPMQYADRFAQLEQEAYSQSLVKIAQRFGQPVADALLDSFSPIKAVQKDIGARGVNKLLQERKRVPAALGLDYVRNLDAYVQSMSVSTSNRAVRDKISVLSADKSMNNAPDFKPMLEAQLQNTLRRGDQTTQQVKTILTSYYLAGNLGSMMVEGAQTLSSLVPALIQNGSSVPGAYGKLAGAMKDVVAYRLNAGTLNALADKAAAYHGVAQMPKDVEKAYYYRRWLQESPDAGSHLEDNTISPDQSAILTARNRNGNYQDLPTSTLARNGLYQLAQKGLKAYSMFSQFNNKAAFLAALEHVQGQGQSGEAAYQSARQLVYGSMFGGGRANSANYIAKLSMSPYMRPIVAIQSTLSTYSLGMTSLLGSLAHDAILGDKTLNPMQRRQAQKAFGVAFATQMSLAGALGLPFAAAGLAVIEKLTGIQANSAVRQGLASLAGDDEELGGLFADVALNGAANQLFGVDVGGRTGLSSILGTSAYSGFTFKDLLGPAPSVLENMANATLSLAQGQVAKGATELLPQSFKHAAQLLDSQRKFGKPQIMDKSNNLIMEPSNMESIMYAMGLNPAKLRNYRSEQKLMQTADDVGARLHDRDLDEIAVRVLQGDARSAVEYVTAQRASNPALDPHALLASIADRVVAMQQPKDLLVGGNQASWNDRAAIASTYPQVDRQSELQKLIAREQTLAQMGYPMGLKPAGTEAYTQAAMLDQMIGQGTPRGQASQKLSYLQRLMRGTAQ